MSEPAADEVVVRATPEDVWAFLGDAAALGRVLPGCESIEADAWGVYRMVLAMKVQFITVRADTVATLHDPQPPSRVTLTIDGRPRGFAGTFHVTIPIELLREETPDGRPLTRVRCSVDAQLTGQLAGFGAPLFRQAMRRQVGELAGNIEREITGGQVAGAGGAPP